MNRHFRLSSTLSASLLLASVSAWAGEPRAAPSQSRAERPTAAAAACVDLRGDLVQAAGAAGVPIHADQFGMTTTGDFTFAGVSIAGNERTPATQFGTGVDSAFVYLNAPASGIPAGFYRLVARADPRDIRIGNYSGFVDFQALDGSTAASVAATFDTPSLSAPNQPNVPWSGVSVGSGFLSINAKRLGSIWLALTYSNGTVLQLVVAMNG